MENKITIYSPLSVVEQPKKTYASKGYADEVQRDLLYMTSVLVSTGQNLNDDVFVSEEMWRARKSPILKPVDWEHNTGSEIITSPLDKLDNPREIVKGNQIIGTMYNSYVVDKDGSIISDEQASADEFEVPQDFHIVNEAVIYKYLFPKVADRIVSFAGKSELFVSMEAWFNDYDYRVGNKIVARNEETAFLDKYLRANGGQGYFGQEKVGRVLRDYVFGGVGIVSNPANKDSVIQSFTNADLKNTKVVNSAVASNIMGVLNSDSQEYQEVYEIMSTPNENVKPDVVKSATVDNEDYKQVVQQLVKAEHTIETKNKELENTKAEVERLSESAATLKTAFENGLKVLAEVLGSDLDGATADNFFDVVSEAIKTKLEASSELESKLEEARAELKKQEDARIVAERKDKIRENLGLAAAIDDTEEVKAAKADRVEKLVKTVSSYDDASFDSWLSEMAGLLSLAAKPDFMKKKGEEDEDKKKKKDEDKSDASEDGITDPSVLDGVKPATASVSAGTEDVQDEQSVGEKFKSLASALLTANKRKVQED